MGTAPTYRFEPDGGDEYTPGMGGLLSTLTFGLVGKKKAPALTHDEIVSQLALVVSNKLAAQGASADLGKVKESLGYNMNAFNAWTQVIADPATVDQITNKTIQDLLNSNLVQVAPGSANSGKTISATGQIIGAQTAPSLAANPTLLAIGLGFGALVLLKGSRRGRR
jgi:hypothetical protein